MGIHLVTFVLCYVVVSVVIIVDRSHTELVTMVATEEDEARELNELKAMLRELAVEVEDFKRSLTQDQQQTYQQQAGWYGGEQPYDRQHTTFDGDIPPDQQVFDDDVREPVCWRCGQSGHIRAGCRVRLDHVRRPLNWDRPTARGRL
jgi:hypothetical protein